MNSSHLKWPKSDRQLSSGDRTRCSKIAGLGLRTKNRDFSRKRRYRQRNGIFSLLVPNVCVTFWRFLAPPSRKQFLPRSSDRNSSESSPACLPPRETPVFMGLQGLEGLSFLTETGKTSQFGKYGFGQSDPKTANFAKSAAIFEETENAPRYLAATRNLGNGRKTVKKQRWIGFQLLVHVDFSFFNPQNVDSISALQHMYMLIHTYIQCAYRYMLWSYYLVQVWPFEGLLSGPSLLKTLFVTKHYKNRGFSTFLCCAPKISGVLIWSKFRFLKCTQLGPDYYNNPTWTR